MKFSLMLWGVTFLILCGTTGQICSSFIYLRYVYLFIPSLSDVSRTSNISVSAYLRTAAAVQGQDDMGNDLLMGRVDLTPMLDGHVGLLF